MNCQSHLYRGLDPNLITRRWFFQQCGVGLGAVALGTLFRESGFFGTNGGSSFDGEPQNFKVPHLRNAYQKVGMFGMPDVPSIRPGDNDDHGPQIRGFGFGHDGSFDTIDRFLRQLKFSFSPDPVTAATQRGNLAEFVLAFDAELAPIVGQQVTLGATSDQAVADRVELLVTRCSTVLTTTANECDLAVKGNVGSAARGYLLDTATGTFVGDRAADPPVDIATLLSYASVPGQELTFTAVPPGSGTRLALDRDEDGARDGDDCAASDPAVFPGATEGCNGIDDDCANGADDGLPVTTWYRDADGDGFGRSDDVISTCQSTGPAGYSRAGGDCDDANSARRPGAPDIPGNTVDENCDGVPVCSPLASWRSQGAYVQCVSNQVNVLVGTGTLTRAQGNEIVRTAVRTRVGR